MAAEMCLLQLPALLSGEPEAQFLPSPFFAEQLTAFELWLAHGSSLKQPPEQLPIVLQVSLVLLCGLVRSANLSLMPCLDCQLGHCTAHFLGRDCILMIYWCTAAGTRTFGSPC